MRGHMLVVCIWNEMEWNLEWSGMGAVGVQRPLIGSPIDAPLAQLRSESLPPLPPQTTYFPLLQGQHTEEPAGWLTHAPERSADALFLHAPGSIVCQREPS